MPDLRVIDSAEALERLARAERLVERDRSRALRALLELAAEHRKCHGDAWLSCGVCQHARRLNTVAHGGLR